MKMVLILEDNHARVAWLRNLDLPVIYTIKNYLVREYIADVRLRVDSVDLVILDHDLGGDPVGLSGSTADVDGKTGLDACREMPVVDCPIIVWSHNPVGAKRMVDCLRERGMYAKHAAFGTQLCEALIREALE